MKGNRQTRTPLWRNGVATARGGIFVAVLALAVLACGDSDAFVGAPGAGVPQPGGATGGATSTLCEGLTGGEAILWDLYNGVPRTDPVLPPPLPVPAAQYIHPGYPALGFEHPVGWTAETLFNGIHDIGVNLLRNDGTAIYRQQTTTENGAPSPRDVRDAELTTAMNFFGVDAGQANVVCVNEGSFAAGGGMQVSVSNILVRANNQTFVVIASVTPFAGLPNSSIRRQVVASPTIEFSARAIDTFLSIDFQMLVGENANLFDSDGDGWRDGVDEFPLDPTRH
jgi:hypothetical protein